MSEVVLRPIAIFAITLVVLLFAAWLGAWVRRRIGLDEKQRDDFSLILAAGLTLLGLLAEPRLGRDQRFRELSLREQWPKLGRLGGAWRRGRLDVVGGHGHLITQKTKGRTLRPAPCSP